MGHPRLRKDPGLKPLFYLPLYPRAEARGFYRYFFHEDLFAKVPISHPSGARMGHPVCSEGKSVG
jgi:hypothetical protein